MFYLKRGRLVLSLLLSLFLFPLAELLKVVLDQEACIELSSSHLVTFRNYKFSLTGINGHILSSPKRRHLINCVDGENQCVIKLFIGK